MRLRLLFAPSWALLFVAVLASSAWAQPESKLVPNDPVASSFFGNAVSMDGDRLLVGRYDNALGQSNEAAYVYDYNGSAWVQTAKLTAPGVGPDDLYAFTVALDGDRAVVGVPYDDDNGSRAGAVYVFDYNGTAWVQTVKLVPSDAGPTQLFGYNVSIDGDRIAVGAPTNSSGATFGGAAYVFDYNGSVWSETAKLTLGSAYDGFGNAVSLDGDRLAVGAVRTPGGTQEGTVYIVDYNGTAWLPTATLTPQNGAAYDQFGISLSLDADRVLIGAYYESSVGSQNGAAYVFDYNGTAWTETAKLIASDAASDRYFGAGVSLQGDRAAVGAWGTNYGSRTGSAYLFSFNGTSWAETHQLTASDGTNTNGYGGPISLTADRVVVGALSDDAVLTDAGAVYVYDLSGPPPPNYVLVSDIGITAGRAAGITGAVHANDTIDLTGHSALYAADLTAVRSITVGSNLTIDGDATAGGAISLGSGATVTGTTSANASVAVVSRPISGPYSAGSQNITVQSGQTRTVNPGTYRRLKVRGNGTLILTAGTYTLDQLIIQRYGAVQADVTNGPVTVNVVSRFVHANDTSLEAFASGSADDTQSHLVTVNSQPGADVAIGARSVFVGTLNANGHVRVKARADVRGSVRGRSIQVDNHAVLAAHGTSVVLRQAAPLTTDAIPHARTETPTTFALDANYPNPFNPTTTIRFALAESGIARLVVFDVLGRQVTELVNQTLDAGAHEVVFDARGLPSGRYVYRLETAQGIAHRTMTLLR